jgi:hypothetical protein
MIHRIRVQNFKSIIDVTVDLSPVTVLVGRSGTGKSNFVQALRFLRDVLSSWQQSSHAFQQAWAQLRPATSTDGAMCFELEFSIAGIEENFKYGLILSITAPQFGQTQLLLLEERLDLGGQILFHQAVNGDQKQVKAQWVTKPELLQLPDSGQPTLGLIPSISEIVDAYTALTSGIGCYMFSDRVLSGDQHEQPTTHMQRATQSTVGLNDSATNYLDALKPIMSDLHDLNVRKGIVAALQRVNPSVTSIALNDIQNPQHVVVGHKFNGKTLALQLSQESDGFRRFYAHLLALYQRPPKQTLIFEHPEDGIHPGALSVLAEEFQAAPEQRRGQVILTTHSPKLLDQFDVDQIRVVELDGFQTRIGHVSPEQQAAIRDDLLDPGELLTVDPARIQPETTGA